MSLTSNLKTLIYIVKHPFNEDQKIKALWNWLRWQVGARLVAAPVMVPWIDKTVLVAKKGETGITQNIYCGLHELSEMGFVLHFLRPEDRFIDIGANSGVYTVLAAGCCGAKGIAIEPIPSTYRRLTQQVVVNRLNILVSTRNIGVADKIGSLYFTTDSDTTNRIVNKEWNGPKDLLPVTTIDEIADEVPALMKIDVEGHDKAVLLGAKNTMASDILKAIIIEISPASISILSQGGFLPCSYDPLKRKLTKLEWSKLNSSPNVIAVRDFEAVEARLLSASIRNFHGKRF